MVTNKKYLTKSVFVAALSKNCLYRRLSMLLGGNSKLKCTAARNQTRNTMPKYVGDVNITITRSSAAAERPRDASCIEYYAKSFTVTQRSLKMVPFASLDTVSYSHFIATMAVFFAVSTQYTNVTARQSPHDSKGRACASHRAAKTQPFKTMCKDDVTAKCHAIKKISNIKMAVYHFILQEAQLSQRPLAASCQWIFREVTQGQSTSFEMALLSRACVSPYQYSIETMSRTVSENGVTLKSGLGVVQGHWKWCHSNFESLHFIVTAAVFCIVSEI